MSVGDAYFTIHHSDTAVWQLTKRCHTYNTLMCLRIFKEIKLIFKWKQGYHSCTSQFCHLSLARITLDFKCTHSWRFFRLHARSVSCAWRCGQRPHDNRTDSRMIPLTTHFLGGVSIRRGKGHRPSIMASRSSPLLLPLAGWSPDSVNSPMILASSALACWSYHTELFW